MYDFSFSFDKYFAAKITKHLFYFEPVQMKYWFCSNLGFEIILEYQTILKWTSLALPPDTS